MPVTNEQYDLYKPTRLKVISLGIGISDETNDTLNLTNTQHLIVGETLLNPGNGTTEKAYGLIVDKQGIAVNATLPDRAAQSNVYAAYIEGNVFVSGNLVACNVISEGGGGGGSGGASNFWIQSTGDRDSIYFPGRITYGNRGNNVVARNNTHACAIVESADRTINHAQISVQNTQLAEFRVGILGTSNISPAVINTVPGTPLEFHVARDQGYFSNVYTRSYWEYGSNVTTTSEIPRYASAAAAPHMVIDTDGTVGMRIAALPSIAPITAEQATPVPTGTGVVFPVVTEKMALHVNGPAFASNLLIWDHQSNVPVNIDRLYVRRYGATFEANQVIPGSFVNEPYVFPDKLGVGGAPDSNFELTVNGAERVTEYLQVDGLTQVNRFEARNAVLLDIASFCNDVYILRDVIVGESVRLRGGMYAEYPGPDGPVWCNVQFQLSDPTLSNVNYFGIGLSTPGRFGVGINPQLDEVNHQFVVRKRSADIYEQEIMDKSSPTLVKAAYIGHPNTAAERQDDASFVFATPGSFNTNYNFRSGVRAPQNFYFYPGDYDPINAAPIVTNSNPPILNVDSRKRVGIKTFDPLGELDVRGNIVLSGNIYRIDPSLVNEITSLTPKVGLWTEATFSSPLPSAGSNVTFRGLQYLQSNVTSAAIHAQPDARYGLTLTGGLRADHQYAGDDVLVSHWASGPNADGTTPDGAGSGSLARSGAAFDPTTPAQSGSMFTYKTIGVGVTNPGGAELTLRNVRAGGADPGAGDDTILRLYRGTPTASRTRIELGGVNTPWIIAGDDANRRLEFGYGSNAIGGAGGAEGAAAKRALWMRYNTDTSRQQVVVGGDLGVFDVGRSNPDVNAALTVDGNISVIGDVRVSGHYYMGGSLFVNCNLVPDFRLPANTDDVLIAGNIISFNPVNITSSGVTTYGFMGVGFTTEALQVERTTTDQTPFRVYQPNQEISTVGRFQATGNTALIDLVNRAGDKLRFGVQSGGRFAFLDKNNAAYMEFATEPATGQRLFGLNTDIAQNITATMHIQNAGQGSNMLRLSRYGVGDVAGAAPEVELEKTIVNGAVTTTTRWLVHGPDQYNQKLSFLYGEGALTDPARTREELMTLTNTGCLGIGNTTPEYALDIIGGNKRGSIRMLNTSPDPSPQLIFQSDSNVYGSDASTDYRFYSSNNAFILDSEDTVRGYQKLMHFNANGRAGVRTTPDDRYALNVGGPLNLLETLYIDGNPVFSTVGEEGTVFDISATNIYLRPFVPAQGGVVINGNQPTSNLFHVFSGSNGTMQVLDSMYDSALVHLRTQVGGPGSGVFNRYTVGVSNVDFGFWYGSNMGRPAMIGDETGTGSGLARLAKIGPNRRAAAAAAGKAEVTVAGDLRLGDVQLMTTSVATPTGGAIIVTHQSNLAAAQDNSLSLATSAILQTVGGNEQLAFSATQFGSADIAQFRNVTIVGEEPIRVIVNNAGYVGIGTIAPTAPFHIGTTYANAGSVELAVRVDVGAVQVPSLRFADSTGVRLTTPGAAGSGNLAILTGPGPGAGSEKVRVGADGKVGIGATAPRAMLHVSPSAAGPSPTLAAYGSNAGAGGTGAPPALYVSQDAWVGIGTDGPALPPAASSPSDPATAYVRSALSVFGGNATFGGALLPTETLAYDLGASNARWRDIYLSGTTMNLGGTTLSRDAASGDVTFADDATNGLRALTVSSVAIGDSAPLAEASPIRVTLSSNPAYNPASPNIAPPLLFAAYDAVTNTTTVLEPLMKGSDTESAIEFSSLYLNEQSRAGSNAALLVDRISGASNVAIAQFRADQTPVFTVFQSGTVGIGAAAIPDPSVFGYPGTEAVYPPLDRALQTCLAVAYSNVGDGAAIASFTQLADSGDGSGGAPADILRLCSPTSNVAADVRFRVTYDGRVGIGLTDAPAAGDRLSMSGNLKVADGTATFGSNVFITNGADLDVAGSIYSGGNLVTASDYRLKSDLQRITGALDRLDKVSGYTFTRPAAADPGLRETGVVAQEIASVLPEAVTVNSAGYMAVAYGNLAGLMIEAVKELRAEVRAIREFVGMQ